MIKLPSFFSLSDFLPMLIYVLVHCDQIHIEIEVEYMWGLLDPPLLSGEGGYYLTTLSSASKYNNLYNRPSLSVWLFWFDFILSDPVIISWNHSHLSLWSYRKNE